MSNPICVLVCGGRDFDDYPLLDRWLTNINGDHKFGVLIHGAARGADSLADRWARSNGVPVHQYPAQWGVHGRAAGPRRNEQMLADGKPDLVVAFKGGRGTAHMVRIAKEAGVQVMEIQ